MNTNALPTAVPTARQLQFQDWEMGLFLHFGIRTFYEGHKDWDGKPMSPEGFNPTQLDCEQWITTAKKAGFRYAVMTAKHHDGFANWPSAHTGYSVKAATKWRDGKGDVVREFVDACRKHDFGVGIYYSPAQANLGGNSIVMDDPTKYDDYFIAQISELLGGEYGTIDMLWFDGCGSENHQYDWPRIIGRIRRMQPNIMIFHLADPDYRWVGNEAGLAQRPNWNTTDQLDVSVRTDRKDVMEPRWLPAECDLMLRDHFWFYQDADAHTIKSVEELTGIYYHSVGRGANMLLNIGPDRRGLLPPGDTQRLLDFGAAIRERFAKPPATTADFTHDATKQSWTWKPAAPVLLDHVVLMEDLTGGEHVRRFVIEIETYLGGREPIVVHEGRNIGHKAICGFPPVRARAVTIRITESDGEPKLRSAAAHHVGRF